MKLGVHTMFYSSQAEQLRLFFRDKLGLAAFDAGDGWLICDIQTAELGCHPLDVENGIPPASGTRDISFFCADLEATMTELKEKGVEFVGGIENHGYGLVAKMKVPGDFTIDLYQPLYSRPTIR